MISLTLKPETLTLRIFYPGFHKGMTQRDTLRYSNWEPAWNPGRFSHIFWYLPNTEKYPGANAKVFRLNCCQAGRSCNKKTTHRDTHTATKPGNQGVKKLLWEQKVKTHLKFVEVSSFNQFCWHVLVFGCV